jgi:hypothetical protein
MAVLFACAPALLAQSSDSGPAQGFHLYTLSIYNSYYSNLPYNTGAGLGSDISAGGTMSMGWVRSRPRSSVSLNYSPSYTRDFTYSQWNTLNHAFSFSASRSLTPYWALTVSTSAEVMNRSNFLFAPTSFSRIVATAATPEELAAAVLPGVAHDNTELASLLTGTAIPVNPGQTLFGERVLNASFQVSAAYRKARWAFALSGGGTRLQNLAAPPQVTGASLVPTASTGHAGVSLSYSLSPRTEFGVSVGTQRTISRIYDGYTSTAVATLGHRMTPRWFTEIHGGGGYLVYVRSSFSAPGPQYSVGASLGFKTNSHTFLAAIDRSIQDTYGIQAISTLGGTGSWRWSRPNSSWQISASASRQAMHSAALQNVSAFVASAGVSYRLTRRAAMTSTYAYMRNSYAPGTLPAAFAVSLPTHSIRAGLTVYLDRR